MSHRFKYRGRAAQYLPHRNRREGLLRRTASLIRNQAQLDEVLMSQPEGLRRAWLETLRPYLRFDPAEMPEQVGDAPVA